MSKKKNNNKKNEQKVDMNIVDFSLLMFLKENKIDFTIEEVYDALSNSTKFVIKSLYFTIVVSSKNSISYSNHSGYYHLTLSDQAINHIKELIKAEVLK